MKEATRNARVSDVRRGMSPGNLRGGGSTAVVSDEVLVPGVEILEDIVLALRIRTGSVLVVVSVLLTIVGGVRGVCSSQLKMDPVSEESLDSSESFVAMEQDESLEMGSSLLADFSSDDCVLNGLTIAGVGYLQLFLIGRVVEGETPTSSLS